MPNQSIHTVVIPAAGIGSRLFPVTRACPKEFFPLGDRSILEHIVDEILQSSVADVIMVTSPDRKSVSEYFELTPLFVEKAAKAQPTLLTRFQTINARLRFHQVVQDEPLGLGHAVLQSERAGRTGPFFVILPDDLMDPMGGATPLEQMESAWIRLGDPEAAVVGLFEVDARDVNRYGIVRVESSAGETVKISDCVEKPPLDRAPSRLAIMGRYLLPPTIFSELSAVSRGSLGEIQLTDALRSLAVRGKLFGVTLSGKRLDTGVWDDYIKAFVHYANKL